MIYTYSYTSKVKLQKSISPRKDTFVLQLSNPGYEISLEPGFYGGHNVTFLDDIYDNHLHKVLSQNQASEITNTLDKINQAPELLEVIVCCDTGKTASAAVVAFMRSRYPKARNTQTLNREQMNNQVLRMLNYANCKGSKPFGTEAAAIALRKAKDELILLLNRISDRSFVENIVAFKVWFKENF